MKKQLLLKTLLAAVLLCVGGSSAWAQVIYSWEGGTPSATETGGTIAATDGSSNDTSKDDVNMSNSTYKVVRLRGVADFSTYKVTITLDNTLAAGDEIWVTGYRNKNSKSPTAGVKMKFNVGEATVGSSTGLEYVNIDTSDASAEDSHRGTTPNICLFSVPASAVGSNTITMTRSHTSTNFFITKIQVVRPTVNANIDFSNDITGTNPYTISGAVSSMTWTNQWTVTPYILDGRLCFGNFTGSVALQNQNIRPKDIVTISFEMAFGKNSGKQVGFKFKNTSGTAFLTQYFDAYNGDFDDNNPLNLDWAYMYRGSNSPLTDRCVYFTIILNYLTGSITTSTKCYMSGTDKAATFHEFTSSFTTSNVLGSFELYGNINTSGRNSTFDNLKISTIEGDYNTTSTITYSYQDQNSNDITDLVLAKGGTENDTPEKGEVYTPVYVSSFVDDEYAYDYTYTSGGDAFTVTGDATITLVYTKTAHPTTDVTVQYKNGSSVLKSDVVHASYPVGKATEYALRKYVLDTTNKELYQTSASMGTQRSPAAAATIEEAVVTANIKNVVFFSEGEEIAGKSATGSSTIASRRSMGRFNSDTKICELEAGKYRFFAEMHCGNGTAGNVHATMYVKAGTENIGSKDIMERTNNQTLQFDFTLSETKNITVQYGGGSNSGIDYIYIMKIGEPVTVSAAGWATYCSPYALDFSSSIANLTKAYLITGHSGATLTLSPITTTIPANTGILLEGAGEVLIPVTGSSSTDVSANILEGVTSATVMTAKSIYVLMNEAAGVGFYKNNYDFTVGANTAYIDATDLAGARSFYLFEDDATAIEAVKAQNVENGQFFNLAGQRVAQPTKGLYIVNGKKVIIK